MDRLSARGLLADLSDVLEEDTRRQLFSGVMTAGIRDGKLAGLPAAVSGVSMVTVEDNWPRDTWTLSEAVELWRQRKGQGAWRFVLQRWSREEAESYFNNAQNLNNAARVIQSRVSLYLAENR